MCMHTLCVADEGPGQVTCTLGPARAGLKFVLFSVIHIRL